MSPCCPGVVQLVMLPFGRTLSRHLGPAFRGGCRGRKAIVLSEAPRRLMGLLHSPTRWNFALTSFLGKPWSLVPIIYYMPSSPSGCFRCCREKSAGFPQLVDVLGGFGINYAVNTRSQKVMVQQSTKSSVRFVILSFFLVFSGEVGRGLCGKVNPFSIAKI